jgi:hypothetical protein
VITHLIAGVKPILEAFVLGKEGVTDKEVIDYLQSQTLVGLIPTPFPIMIRKSLDQDEGMKRNLGIWFLSYFWVLFVTFVW